MFTNIAYNQKTKQFGVIAYWNIERDRAKIMNAGMWPIEDFIILTKDQYIFLDQYTRELDINESWTSPSNKLIAYVFCETVK